MVVHPAASVTPASGMMRSALDDLGVRLHDGVGTLRIWSDHATAVELVVFDDTDLDWITDILPLAPAGDGVWSVTTPRLHAGVRYAVRVDGPSGARNMFSRLMPLLDPYSRGLVSGGMDDWRSVVIDGSFDWGGVPKPATPLDETVIYEGHVKGLTKRHPLVPPALHGTYAGLAHPAMIDHLLTLGVTAVELLPVHAFVSEPHLLQQGLTNYWGYNTLNFFTPHGAYATDANRRGGPEAIVREFKGMVRLLHEAGLEVILDVVFNHTSEAGMGGRRTSLRGIDNRAYYRQNSDGSYIDVTGCGNSVDTSREAPARLVLDSLRYWANDMQIDGFRYDLTATLGRDAAHEFTPDHPLLRAIIDDSALAGVKNIAEPWDVGMGGWQTGNFSTGWHEWNDRYRDRVRNFWLSDVDYARRASTSPVGVGGFATRLAGSSNTFSTERGPLASVNFVTAHDGFTLHDLVSYDIKHNLGNGEQNRDGTETNRSFNHGVEGSTDDSTVLATRRKAMRNLLGTLFLSAGIPMLTAGDEFGRTQRGNNNAYCHDSPLTWLTWDHEQWQEDLSAHVQRLIELRRDNPALRPRSFAHEEMHVPDSSRVHWYDDRGETVSLEQWRSPTHRTLQYAAISAAEAEQQNRILLIVHGTEHPTDVILPMIEGATSMISLWSSEDEVPRLHRTASSPGDVIRLAGTAMHLFRIE